LTHRRLAKKGIQKYIALTGLRPEGPEKKRGHISTKQWESQKNLLAIGIKGALWNDGRSRAKEEVRGRL